MHNKILKLSIFLLLFFNTIIHSEVFRFSFSEGEIQKMSSTVQEAVYFNGSFSYRTEIINRIVAKVNEIKEEASRRSALYSCYFMVTEKTEDGRFNWGKEYNSSFWRNDLGLYSISDKYFMPMVRDIPSFPEYDVQIGDSWVLKAHEAYDFSDAFGMIKPIIVPFDVEYKYTGTQIEDGEPLHIIDVKYQKDFVIPDSLLQRMSHIKNEIYPLQTRVESNQRIAWSQERGNIAFYDETFTIYLFLNDGETVEYTGTSHSKITLLKKDVELQENEKIKQDIEKLNLANTNIKKTEKGLTIVLENIQFAPNSSILRDSEKEKIKSIAEVLKKYGKRDILIEGHTVFSSTEERRISLSEERAKVVAEYLLNLGVASKEHIFTKGRGGDFPLFPNTTEENKARNRRVEITIME
ncbi:MAG: OmpA family protein [Treponema sp.]